MNDRKRLAKQQKAVRAESDAINAEIQDLLSKRGGRLFVWWLLEITNHGQQPFTGVAATTDFNCGILNVGQQILARILQVDPQGYVRLLAERAAPDAEPGTYDYLDPRDGDEE